MNDDSKEFYDRIEGDSLIILDNIAEITCQSLLKMSKEQRKLVLTKLSLYRLKEYSRIACDSEYYEICQSIKEIFEEAGLEFD